MDDDATEPFGSSATDCEKAAASFDGRRLTSAGNEHAT
jgi:hypothetical protein